ncbi:hypothetical protein V5N11_033107 [Cardamine amara subsp. amara]|uniref:Uncharacterized protein n=1 Tax=Cardamine amara subsp. amara TaxID=228776 RepID=A0ABD1AR67_CARAN
MDGVFIQPHNNITLVHPGRACDQSPPPSMQPPAPPLAVPLPEEPEPKRQKFDDESALAQHSGSSTIIRLFVPDVGEVVIRK